MYASITRLTLRSIWNLSSFFKHVRHIDQQLQNTPGLISVAKKPLSPWIWCTLTHWDSRESMVDFMMKDAHREAMQDTRRIASQSISHGYYCNSEQSWDTALETLEVNIH